MSDESGAGSRPEIENLLAEKRTFPPDPGFAAIGGPPVVVPTPPKRR